MDPRGTSWHMMARVTQLSFQSTSDVRSPSVVLATKPAAAGPPAPSARAGPVDVGAPPTALRIAFPRPAKRFTQEGIPWLPEVRVWRLVLQTA